MNILEAMEDRNLFGPWFKNGDFTAWRAFLAALFAHPIPNHSLDLFRACTARNCPPIAAAREAWLVVGRRGGKSFISALVAVYLACFKQYKLSPGEVGNVIVLAGDKRQARVVFRYIDNLLTVPLIAPLVTRRRVSVDNWVLELQNNISIEVMTADFRRLRGYTVVACIADEVAYWRSEETANPDTEILNAVRPGMATVPGALLLCLSSPYARRGALWEAYREYYGQEGDVLVWKADSATMNPTIPEGIIKRAYTRDPTSAAAEYGAEFRTDVEGFLSGDWIDAAVDNGVHERPPEKGIAYHAFTDPSGGRQDSFTLAIAHSEQGSVVLDLLKGYHPPFDPDAVTRDFAGILKRYGIHRVKGDRYAGEWVSASFQDKGIAYDASKRSKSEIYLESEPLFATGTIRLLDHVTLQGELRNLERKTGRTKDIVDHPPKGHDDYANAAAGALVEARETIPIDADGFRIAGQLEAADLFAPWNEAGFEGMQTPSFLDYTQEYEQ